jgi:hypothetical protein
MTNSTENISQDFHDSEFYLLNVEELLRNKLELANNILFILAGYDDSLAITKEQFEMAKLNNIETEKSFIRRILELYCIFVGHPFTTLIPSIWAMNPLDWKKEIKKCKSAKEDHN